MCQNGQHKQINKQVLGRLWREGNLSALLVGMQTAAATLGAVYIMDPLYVCKHYVENSMEFTQNLKIDCLLIQ